jgi:hypothetical protein
MIRADDLREEDPQRHQRRIDAVLPARLDRLHGRRDRLRRENVGEGELSFLQKLTPEEIDLLPQPSLAKIAHL